MTNYVPGTIVGSARFGDSVIVETRRIKRGRHAGNTEFHLAPLDPPKKSTIFGWRCGGTNWLAPPKREWTDEQIADAIARYEGRSAKRFEQRATRTEQRQAAVAAMPDLREGDVVLVDFSDGKATRVVGGVNHRTGKIGVQRHQATLAAMERRAAERDAFLAKADFLGLDTRGARRSTVRKLRWIAASFILYVERDGQIIWRKP